jgi:hypothetical protein
MAMTEAAPPGPRDMDERDAASANAPVMLLGEKIAETTMLRLLRHDRRCRAVCRKHVPNDAGSSNPFRRLTLYLCAEARE